MLNVLFRILPFVNALSLFFVSSPALAAKLSQSDLVVLTTIAIQAESHNRYFNDLLHEYKNRINERIQFYIDQGVNITPDYHFNNFNYINSVQQSRWQAYLIERAAKAIFNHVSSFDGHFNSKSVGSLCHLRLQITNALQTSLHDVFSIITKVNAANLTTQPESVAKINEAYSLYYNGWQKNELSFATEDYVETLIESVRKVYGRLFPIECYLDDFRTLYQLWTNFNLFESIDLHSSCAEPPQSDLLSGIDFPNGEGIWNHRIGKYFQKKSPAIEEVQEFLKNKVKLNQKIELEDLDLSLIKKNKAREFIKKRLETFKKTFALIPNDLSANKPENSPADEIRIEPTELKEPIEVLIDHQPNLNDTFEQLDSKSNPPHLNLDDEIQDTEKDISFIDISDFIISEAKRISLEKKRQKQQEIASRRAEVRLDKDLPQEVSPPQPESRTSKIRLVGKAAEVYKTAMGLKTRDKTHRNRDVEEFLRQVGGRFVRLHKDIQMEVPNRKPEGKNRYVFGKMHLCHGGSETFGEGTLRTFLKRLILDSGLNSIIEVDE